MAICKRALADGPLDTRQLALACHPRAKGMDPGDKVLAKSIWLETHSHPAWLYMRDRAKLIAKELVYWPGGPGFGDLPPDEVKTLAWIPSLTNRHSLVC